MATLRQASENWVENAFNALKTRVNSAWARVTKSGTVATITIHDTNGVTTTASVSDGYQGEDGVSPAVTITTITGGHTVNITDKTHPSGQSFNVMDGSAGDYEDLTSKPQIAGTTLSGNRSLADLGIMASSVTHLSGDVPTTRKVNNKALSADISLSASDVGARASDWMPSASDVGALPSSTKHLSGDISTSDSRVSGWQTAATQTHTHSNKSVLDAIMSAPIAATDKGVANGVATLGSNGKLTSSQMPTVTVPTKTSDLTNDGEGVAGKPFLIDHQDISGKQDVANLKTGLSEDSDAYYPSQKAVKTAVDAKQDKIYTLIPEFTPDTATLSSSDGATITCDIEYSDLELSDGDWSCTAHFSSADPAVEFDETFTTTDGSHSEADTSVNFVDQTVSYTHVGVEYSATFTITATRTQSYCGANADATPTSDSNRLVTSGGVYDAVGGKQDALTEGTGISISANNVISTDAVRSFSTVGTQTPTVTNGVADLSTLFSSANTSLVGEINYTIGDSGNPADHTVRTLGTLSTATTLTIAAPRKSGALRDFAITFTEPSTAVGVTFSTTDAASNALTFYGEFLTPAASTTYIYYLTEIAQNTFLVKGEEISTVTPPTI